MLCFCTFLTILEHFGTKAFKKPVAPAGYKNKQTVSRRRYLARVLSSLMYRYALRQSASVSRFLYPAKGYGDVSLTFHLQLCGPLGQIPDLGSQAIVEFRLMADHENTSLVFFQCPFQLVFGIHIQMVRWLVQ